MEAAIACSAMILSFHRFCSGHGMNSVPCEDGVNTTLTHLHRILSGNQRIPAVSQVRIYRDRSALYARGDASAFLPWDVDISKLCLPADILAFRQDIAGTVKAESSRR